MKLLALTLTALLFLPTFASAADPSAHEQEVIDAENIVTGLEHDRDSFERRHDADSKKWSQEEKSQYDAILEKLNKAEDEARAMYKKYSTTKAGGKSGKRKIASAEKLLDCNIGFGDLSQIQINKDGGQMTYTVLTTAGSWKGPFPLSTEQWVNRDINFDYKADRYHVWSPKGKFWNYEIFSFGSKSPNTTGGLDCD